MQENIETEKIKVKITCPICSKKLNTKLNSNMKYEPWCDFIFQCPKCEQYAIVPKSEILNDNQNIIS